jgi:phage terminase large subunit-like protein
MLAVPQLKDQMCKWVPGAEKPPDRVDALVWAISNLIGIGMQNENIYETTFFGFAMANTRGTCV